MALPLFANARRRTRRPATPVFSRNRIELLEARRLLSGFEVTSTDDSGAGSLRQAILDANASPGADTISFNLAASDARHLYYRDNGIAGQVSVAQIAPTAASDDATIAD